MNIVVCIKRVPQTADAEVRVDSSGKDIEREYLTFDMNEYDAYALEEAVLFKEKSGGTVTAISVGPQEAEDTLRIAMAKGADSAIRIKAEDFEEIDALKTAQLLAAIIKDLEFDVVLCGSVATDDAYSQVGATLAQLLDVPHATLVTKIETGQGRAHVYRELEGGLLEHLDMTLPAVIGVQSGINVPRYASLLGIRKAAKKEIKAVGQNEIRKDTLTSDGHLERLFAPPVAKRAEILTGDPAEVSEKLTNIIKEKGLL